ncbi:hypothetical protein V493_00753 [Pseudogymnoascus sp. VKM F-4281 (FW-2241)]|nr:hypothetical protein V493_00753 [Pseudogymnoascus sp. VKM F-4281 (FW-2241)]
MSSPFYPPLPAPSNGIPPEVHWSPPLTPQPPGGGLQAPLVPQRPHSAGLQPSPYSGGLHPPLPPQPTSGGLQPPLPPQPTGGGLQPPLPSQPTSGGFGPSEQQSRWQWLQQPPKAPKSNSKPSNPPKPTTYTKEQREAINRVLKLPENHYYRILGLLQSCTEEEIKKRYHKLCLLIHPDKNKFSDASKAFHRIQTACTVLSNPTERQSFDRLQKAYQPPHKDPFGEEFHDNAFGNDSDTESEEGFENYGPSVPDEVCMKIYERATPYIRNLQRNTFLDEDTKAALDNLNKEIGEHNESHGLTEERKYDFYIDYGIIATNLDLARPYAERLKSNPDDGQALQWVIYYQNVVTNHIREKGYPNSWVIVRSEDGREIENDVDMNPPARPASEGDADEIKYALQKYSFKPGYTSDGERILGCCPVYRTSWVDGVESFHHGYFMIEKPGELNPVALMSSADVGRQATLGYLQLPDDEKYDLRDNDYKYDQRDTIAFRRVIGFASNPPQSKEIKSGFRYPTGYVLAMFDYGKGEVPLPMTRGKLRMIMGVKAADKEIARFYEITKLTPPWEVEPRSFHDNQRPGVKQLPWPAQSRLLTYKGNELEDFGSDESEWDTGRQIRGRDTVYDEPRPAAANAGPPASLCW